MVQLFCKGTVIIYGKGVQIRIRGKILVQAFRDRDRAKFQFLKALSAHDPVSGGVNHELQGGLFEYSLFSYLHQPTPSRKL